MELRGGTEFAGQDGTIKEVAPDRSLYATLQLKETGSKALHMHEEKQPSLEIFTPHTEGERRGEAPFF